jgi:hypothetical protein
VASGGVGVAVAYSLATSLESFLERLMTQRGRDMRGPFVMVSMIAAGASAALAVAGAFVFASRLAYPATAGLSASIGPIASAISIYSIYLYWRQVQDAQTGAQNMVRSGRFDPDAATSGPTLVPMPVAVPVPAPVQPPMPMAPPPPP